MDRNNGSEINRTLSDDEIISLYFKREERAISETDLKYGHYLHTIAYNILRDRADADECMNDTYFGTWNAIPPHRPNVFQVFLSRITRNIAIGKVRKRGAEKRIPSELIMSLDELDECVFVDENAEEKFLISQLSEVLNEFLYELSDRHRFIFVCRYYYSDPIERIAKMLGLSENTIFRDLKRMREGLRERLVKEGYWNE
jgi:RNA polymerase sigma-70 factor (ECF subfamily)